MQAFQIFLIFILTPQISPSNFAEEEQEKLKISHEFAKIFLESSIPMYIQQNLREKLKDSLHNPLILNKFHFKDCEGKEYNSDEFVDNYLLAGKLGENLKIAVGSLSVFKRKEFMRTYLTKLSTHLDSYKISVTASSSSTDIHIHSIVPECKIQYCN